MYYNVECGEDCIISPCVTYFINYAVSPHILSPFISVCFIFFRVTSSILSPFISVYFIFFRVTSYVLEVSLTIPGLVCCFEESDTFVFPLLSDFPVCIYHYDVGLARDGTQEYMGAPALNIHVKEYNTAIVMYPPNSVCIVCYYGYE